MDCILLERAKAEQVAGIWMYVTELFAGRERGYLNWEYRGRLERVFFNLKTLLFFSRTFAFRDFMLTAVTHCTLGHGSCSPRWNMSEKLSERSAGVISYRLSPRESASGSRAGPTAHAGPRLREPGWRHSRQQRGVRSGRSFSARKMWTREEKCENDPEVGRVQVLLRFGCRGHVGSLA